MLKKKKYFKLFKHEKFLKVIGTGGIHPIYVAHAFKEIEGKYVTSNFYVL